jgi:hypothetical protein
MMSVALSSPALPADAGKPESLDKDFLDYLAACEGKDDNWTVIDGDRRNSKSAEKAPAKPPAPVDKSAPKPEAKP